MTIRTDENRNQALAFHLRCCRGPVPTFQRDFTQNVSKTMKAMFK